MKELIPHIAFLGAKGSGKSSTIKKIWAQDFSDNQMMVTEDIEGRGTLKYDVTEYQYIPLSVSEETDSWIENNRESLSSMDTIVYLIEANDITYSKKAKFLGRLQTEGLIKNNARIIIGISLIEYSVDIDEMNNSYCICLDDVTTILSQYKTVLAEFSRFLCSEKNELSVVPFSYNADWQIKELKQSIIEGVISRQNDLTYNNESSTVVFVGKTGCGKSSSINHICGTQLPVDGSVACTKYPIVINKDIIVEGKNRNLNIVDLPGIAESLEANIIYNDYYNKYIKDASVIVCLSQANTRAYTQDEVFYKSLISSGILRDDKTIILGINKIDLLFKSEEHLAGIDLSTTTDEDPLIEDKVNDYYDNVFASVFKMFPKVTRESVVVYSVYQNWNINKLVHKIITNI